MLNYWFKTKMPYLGNVLGVITDNIYFTPAITSTKLITTSDYYPFGLDMKSRSYTTSSDSLVQYRYGYQGQYSEFDPETFLNHFEYRQFDPKIGRWLIVDLERQHNSPYLGMSNNPILYIDRDGLIDWRAAGEAALAIAGGTGEVLLGLGSSATGIGAVVGVILITDGSTRAIMGIPKLVLALSEEGNISVDARETSTNMGQLAGTAFDEANDNKTNLKKVLGTVNDFASIAVTGGSALNYQTLAQSVNAYQRASALFNQTSLWYNVWNSAGQIQKLENNYFLMNNNFDPNSSCPSCLILDNVTIYSED